MGVVRMGVTKVHPVMMKSLSEKHYHLSDYGFEYSKYIYFVCNIPYK